MRRLTISAPNDYAELTPESMAEILDCLDLSKYKYYYIADRKAGELIIMASDQSYEEIKNKLKLDFPQYTIE